MPNARLTVKAMQKILNEDSKSMADYWNLTEASPLYDKDMLVWTIMKRGGSLEVLEYDPDDFYTDCAFWWTKWNRTFNKWIAALGIEYNPLENYDRNEDWTDSEENATDKTTTRTSHGTIDDDTTNTKTLNTQEVLDGESTLSKNGTETVTLNSDTDVHSELVYQRNAFNDYGWSDTNKEITDSNTNVDSTQTTSYNTVESGTEDATTTQTGTISDVGTAAKVIDISDVVAVDDDGTKEGTHSGRIHGNIGVTTSQAMLEAELKLQYWNLYNHMADLFIQECTTRVY